MAGVPAATAHSRHGSPSAPPAPAPSPAPRLVTLAVTQTATASSSRPSRPLGRVAQRGPSTATFPAPASFSRTRTKRRQPGGPAARQRRPRGRGQLSGRCRRHSRQPVAPHHLGHYRPHSRLALAFLTLSALSCTGCSTFSATIRSGPTSAAPCFACHEIFAQVSRAVVWLLARAGCGVCACRSSPYPPPTPPAPVAAPAPALPAVRTCSMFFFRYSVIGMPVHECAHALYCLS